MKIKRRYLSTYQIVNKINELSGEPDNEWGEWFIGLHVHYLIEGHPSSPLALLENIFTNKAVSLRVLDDIQEELTKIEYEILNTKDILDFSQVRTGVLIEVYDEKNLY